MSPSTILALLGAIETIIQATPEALALFETVKTMFAANTEPTSDQWAALNALLAADHAAVQAG